LFDWKVALVYGTMAPGPELKFPLERWTGEKLKDLPRSVGVELRIDPVAFENGKSDFLKRLAQVLREISSLALIPAQKAADVHGPDRVRLAEGLAAFSFGQAFFLPLVYLIEANEILVLRIDPLDFTVRHCFLPRSPNHSLADSSCQARSSTCR